MTSTASIAAPKEKVFFPNLDALRFFSFLSVFLFHSYRLSFIYLEKEWPQLFAFLGLLFRNGNMGVNFFFVLSGFLITYLLLREKDKTGEIALGKFYVRRILRIWPLFYLCVFIGFVVFPLGKSLAGGAPPDESANPVYYLLLINNFDFINDWPIVPDALILVVLWSVAVEEQFYIAWPVIAKFVKDKFLPVAFVLVIVASLVFRFYHRSDSSADYAIRYFHTLSVIGDMALGGLFAWFTARPGRFLHFVTNASRAFMLLIYVSALLVTLFKKDIFHTPGLIVIERLVVSLLYGMIILEQCFSVRPLFRFGRLKLASKLGIYTYGLYCWHFFVLSVMIALAGKLQLSLADAFTNILVVIGALGVSIAVSLLSYHLFEQWFLKWKDRFAVIVKK